MDQKIHRIPASRLHDLCVQVFSRMGMTEEDGRLTAEVLLSADLRGIDSHGVARLSFYVNGMRNGVMRPKGETVVVTETPATALIDAGGGMGVPVSVRAMRMAIEKAKQVGMGWVNVRNSNHYGIAGYYAMMALEHDCVGISMTNSAVFVVPTFGRDSMLGTNPIAVAAPGLHERPYVLDMATSVVPFGKIETYNRLGKPLPPGWAMDENGNPTSDPARVVEHARAGSYRGGLAPLGGTGEEHGGHKGYGLTLLVDVLCGVLPGALYANLVYPKTENGRLLPSGIGHTFAALRIDAIRPVDEFKASMDDLQRRLKDAPKAEGQDRIYIHGEKEFEEAERRLRDGIPLNAKVYADIKTVAAELDVPFD
jgi:LDH2 family malate/lactate/ureidoglycolate dehydrogenase